MLVLSLRTQIEESNSLGKNLTGAIQSFEFMERADALKALEREHPGFFSFLAFHPSADTTVSAYVKAGTLPSDSGPHNMVLFTMDERAAWPTEFHEPSPALPFIQVDRSTHAAYAAVRFLFDPKAPPPLPGIAFFRRFTSDEKVIYVDLTGLDGEEQTRNRLRFVLATAEKAFATADATGRDFANELAFMLECAEVSFTQTGRIAVRQWLLRVYRYAEEHAGDIVSAVKLF